MYVERREIFELRPRQAFLILFETIEENSAVTFPNHQTGNFGRVGGDGGGHDPRFPTWPFNVRLRVVRVSPRHEAVGIAIKDRRAELGITQTTLSSQLGIDRKTLRSWERGNTVPGRRHQNLLIKCLEVDIPKAMPPA